MLLEVKNLKKYYPVKKGLFRKPVVWVKAVDDVSFSIAEGKTLGLVGESGCGKTTLARTVLRLIEPDAGQVYFKGQALTELAPDKIRSLRKDLQIIFQDPFNSLDPRFTVAEIISEGLLEGTPRPNRGQILSLSEKILGEVGLEPDSLWRYPHEFSGGQRQRISIARSLILNPKLLLLDEPVSSLDVSIQAQIINLLLELQHKLGLTYLFIAHDLGVIRCVSDEVCVMYLGRIVEKASAAELFRNPLHPYTKVLLASSPQLEIDKNRKKPAPVEKGTDNYENTAEGCRFLPRCRVKLAACRRGRPYLKEVTPGHWVSCFCHYAEFI